MLVQYKAAFKQVQGEEFPNVEAFMNKYRLDAPAAVERYTGDFECLGLVYVLCVQD